MNGQFSNVLEEVVLNNLTNENFGPEDFAKKMGMSHSTLHRKIKDISSQTISQFIREIRLKKASEILLNENFTVSEVAYKVGFGSVSYFTKCFHDFYGISPGEYKKQVTNIKQQKAKPKWNIQKILLYVVAPILILLLVFLFLNEKYTLF